MKLLGTDRGVRCLLCAIALIGLPCAARADGAAGTTGDTSASTELLLDGNDIVTTATRTPQHVNDSPEAVTVISEEDILASGATTVPELLRSVPGVDVMEPNLSQQNVSIRGFNQTFANTVLVMVDGRRINEDTSSSVFWTTDPILLTRIKRIEIVRGPGSVLYGADAFCGVINIILKTPEEAAAENKQGTFEGQYESHAVEFGEASYTFGDQRKWAASVGVGYHGVTGPYAGQAGKLQDSSSVPIATLDIQKPMSRGSLLFTFDNADSKAQLTSEALQQYVRGRTNIASLAYTEDRGPNPLMVRYYESYLNIHGYAQSQSGEFDLQQQRELGSKNNLTYGASYRDSTDAAQPTGFDSRQEHVAGLFVQDEDRLAPATTLFCGLRQDDHSLYGRQISTRFSLVHHLSPSQTLRLSYGNAFSAPTFIESFVDSVNPIAPGLNLKFIENTGLRPEQIKSSEAGYRVDLAAGFAGLNVYYNQIADIIEPSVLSYAPPPYPAGIPSVVDYKNVGTSYADGLEVEGGFPVGRGWNALANYSYEHISSNDPSSLDFSPQNMFNLILQSDRERGLTCYLAGHYVGSTISYGQGLRAYTTVDVRIGYRLGRSQDAWTAALAATNLLDDHHREFLDPTGTASSLSASEPAQRYIRLELSGKF